MARRLAFDKLMFTATIALVLSGICMVYSASALVAEREFSNPNHYLLKQAVAAGLGLLLMVAAMGVDYRRYDRPRVVAAVVAAAILSLMLVLVLDPNQDFQRWFRLGPFSLQPSEAAKLAVVVFFAYLLERRAEQVDSLPKVLLPSMALLGVTTLLVAIQPDLGTAISLGLIGAVMLFLAGLRLAWMVGAAALVVPLLAFAIWKVEYWRLRILAFVDPWRDQLGYGFQSIQSLIAVASGGATGVGFVESHQKRFFLPEPHTDFIFAVVGEELGLVGCLAFLSLYALLVWRGLRAALRAPDRFGFFLAAGITLQIALQALINISVVLKLLPTKGMPLPFLSSGGSSLMVTLAAIGVLLNISQHDGY
jgi:cell division protein FtsW